MRLLLPAACVALCSAALQAQQSFVNFETPHVTPLALSADGSELYAVNTPDGVLEVFDVSSGTPLPAFHVPVGVDPISVRVRNAGEVWVVNHVSDSISVVDLGLRNVVATLDTPDEPCDVVFAGNPERAFVSCAQTDQVLVYDPTDLSLAPSVIEIEGEEPRAMAVSSDGSEVYVAVFESGNHSTILGGGLDNSGVLVLNNVVSDPAGPYGGQNPPPNAGTGFQPALNPNNTTPPEVGLIVKRNAAGQWMDDNGGDWTDLVSGGNSALSNRPAGWEVVDNDVAVIDTQTLGVSYVERLMNICMALAVHPISGEICVVGTDATNEVRYEPNLTGVFLRVNLALADSAGTSSTVLDLNPQLNYSVGTLPQVTRDQALGDPRGIAWNAAGDRGYVSGMGSNNVVVIDASGARVGSPIEVGEGPTGVALDDAASRLYVLNKFDSSVSAIDVGTASELARVPFHDASPPPIKQGRVHLYGTHESSGLGHIACASCHVDARMDRLAWDLGDPGGDMDPLNGQNLGMGVPGLNTGFDDFHPMKGPMTTQTMQDIIGKEPLHWRGDRDGLEDFNPAFVGLQGDDAMLDPVAMQQFEDFLATIHFQPNPLRNFDNTLPNAVDLSGYPSSGRFSVAGTPLPTGNAVTGLFRYTNSALDSPFRCVTCHTLPTGIGADMFLSGGVYMPFPEGPNGEKHHALVSVDGSTQNHFKVPQIRNEIEKNGFSLTGQRSRAGFGVLHDGSVPGIVAFLSSPAFSFTSDQDLANMVAFVLSISGSQLPMGSPTDLFVPPGPLSKDAHAAVGKQSTLVDIASAPAAQSALLTSMLGQANIDRVGLIVKGRVSGEARGYAMVGGSMFQGDRAADVLSYTALTQLAAAGSELTFTVVPFGSETRLGIDRDEDGFFDRDELDAGSDPADASSIPDLGSNYCGPAATNSSGAAAQIFATGSALATANDLTLTASNLPTQQFGYFLNSMTQGFVMGAGGSQGNLCLSGGIGRYSANIMNSGASGSFSLTLDLTQTPTNMVPTSVVAGQTWNFQAWFRDVNPSNTSNFTDGLSVLFQ